MKLKHNVYKHGGSRLFLENGDKPRIPLVDTYHTEKFAVAVRDFVLDWLSENTDYQIDLSDVPEAENQLDSMHKTLQRKRKELESLKQYSNTLLEQINALNDKLALLELYKIPCTCSSVVTESTSQINRCARCTRIKELEEKVFTE